MNFQKPWQDRDIETSIPGFMGDFNHKFNGKASAPIVPALFASWKKDRIAVSAMIGIVGSGGFVEYKERVPMFNVPIMALLAQSGVTPDMYTLDSQMKGKQYIYGGQLNFTYKITDYLAAAVGFRANYYDGYYRGHVVADMNGTKLINLQLDFLNPYDFRQRHSVQFIIQKDCNSIALSHSVKSPLLLMFGIDARTHSPLKPTVNTFPLSLGSGTGIY